MTLTNPKRFYSRFLKGHAGKLHFRAHSHHFWPDVSREAQIAYWDDCAVLGDEKWDRIFSETIPRTQNHIAKILGLKEPRQIALAPNTHELAARLLSLFLGRKSLRILTTTNEFHSWRRQFLRLMEIPGITIRQVDAADFLRDRAAFLNDMKSELAKSYDLVFLSQVFFDSGAALMDGDIESLVAAAPDSTLFAVDGYHGFAAIPCNLARLEGRIFYLGGGYKYGQGGEGVGFMVVPKGNWRPADTGWYAEVAQLSRPAGEAVGYPDDGMAFMGSTQDPSGFYRFNAVWDLFDAEGIDIRGIHSYVVGLQKAFLDNLPQRFMQDWSLTPLFDPVLDWHGHFLTFEAASLEIAEKCLQILNDNDILIDRRGTRLRFGFGLYQDETDVIELCRRLEELAG
ncbi:selenocysteine lyase [Methylobacter sp. BlB1]|uniref:selenocysteine lyase n=1 Tax=Methylobacter sp. BlB1 TaxID=2785914 RepID=UPI0018953DF9|nr:selenocysteine lyase [Methylobacter sp. BlB1]MBF6651054.1 selenocysteine lyase [Methylobacter sp. BlB1]